MPTSDPSDVVSSRPLPPGAGDTPLPSDAVPMPMPMPLPEPIAPGEPPPDGSGRVRIVAGTEADDTLTLEGGATAIGGGGDDTFVLVSSGAEGLERLGAILDFNAGDKLDLSRLGSKAAVLGREVIEGGERVSIDYDGDGDADGVLVTYTGKGPATIEPAPGDGEVRILPFPMPAGEGEGEGDGEFHILPFPMSFEAEDLVTLTVADTLGASPVFSGWVAG
jgi:hypothetical protein